MKKLILYLSSPLIVVLFFIPKCFDDLCWDASAYTRGSIYLNIYCDDDYDETDPEDLCPDPPMGIEGVELTVCWSGQQLNTPYCGPIAVSSTPSVLPTMTLEPTPTPSPTPTNPPTCQLTTACAPMVQPTLACVKLVQNSCYQETVDTVTDEVYMYRIGEDMIGDFLIQVDHENDFISQTLLIQVNGHDACGHVNTVYRDLVLYPPLVKESIPVHQSLDVAVDSTISITFNTPMDAENIQVGFYIYDAVNDEYPEDPDYLYAFGQSIADGEFDTNLVGYWYNENDELVFNGYYEKGCDHPTELVIYPREGCWPENTQLRYSIENISSGEEVSDLEGNALHGRVNYVFTTREKTLEECQPKTILESCDG